ncbi:MAG TPA: nuclear transport factor 2 family protein [Allosphingosinicella sp.]|jgi:hypothetical protein
MTVPPTTSPPAIVCPSEEPKTPEGLRRAEGDWVRAIERRDTARLGCRLAAGFVEFNWQGRRIAREAILAALPHRPASALRLTQVEARVYGDVGVVRGSNTQRDPCGRVVGTVRFTDIFLFRVGRWQAFAAQETSVSAVRTSR